MSATMTPSERNQRIHTVCLFILATVAIGATLFWLRSVMVPFVLSLFLALGLSPLVDFQTRNLRFPRWLAVVGTLLIAIAILTLVGALITQSARGLAANAGDYQAGVTELINGFLERFPLERFGINPDEAVRLPLQAISTVAVNISGAIIDLVSRGSIVLIFLMFLMLGGSASTAPVGGTWGEVEVRIKRYIAFKAVISAVTGMLVGTVLWVLGVDLATVFGLMAFLLNFIPSIGSAVATLLPLPVVLVSPNLSTAAAVLAIAIPGAIQFAVGNVIEPKIMGDELDLHPVTILLALMIWGALWGIVGMLLAVPITAVMKILMERGELTRPVADLFAGRLDALRQA